MRYDSERHHRRSIRLKGYDYRQVGGYFITLVTQDRACLFGEVVDGEMRMNEYGQIAWEEWFRSAEIRREIRLYPDEFVVMPNHIHCMDCGTPCRGDGPVAPTPGAHDCVRAHRRAPLQRPPRSLSSFVAGFKSAVTKRINEHRGTPGAPVWQRNYYEHIIRNEDDLEAIRHYILTNPSRWHEDRENPYFVIADPSV
jgi:REP element-mobilizing transposase RayT